MVEWTCSEREGRTRRAAIVTVLRGGCRVDLTVFGGSGPYMEFNRSYDKWGRPLTWRERRGEG